MNLFLRSFRWRVAVLLCALALLGGCGESDVVRTNGGGAAGKSAQTDQPDYDEWFDSQNTVIAPWAHELNHEVVRSATIEDSRLTFPRAGNEDLLAFEVNEIIYANDPEIASTNISRRITHIEDGDDVIVIDTEVAKLNEIYLKLSGDLARNLPQPLTLQSQPDVRHQGLNSTFPVSMSMGYTVDVRMCQSDHGSVRFCEEEEGGASHGESEVHVFVEPTVTTTINNLELTVNIDPPTEAMCRCVSRYYSLDERKRPYNYKSPKDKFHTISDNCGHLASAVEKNFWDSEAGFMQDIIRVRKDCIGDPTNFKFGVDGDVTATLPMEAGFTQTFTLGEKELLKKTTLLRIPIPMTAVTVVLAASIDVNGKLTAEGSVGISMKEHPPTAKFPMNFGVEWTKGHPIETYQQNPNRTQGSPFTLGRVKFTGNVKLIAEIEGEGSITSKFWDAAGPIFTVAPYFHGEVGVGAESQSGRNNATCQIQANAGIRLKIGAEAGIPFTDAAKAFTVTILDTCKSSTEWIKNHLCAEYKSADPCRARADTYWIQVAVHSNNGDQSSEDPPGLDLDTVYMVDNKGAAHPVKEALFGTANVFGSYEAIDVDSLGKNQNVFSYTCMNSVDLPSAADWASTVVSIPDGSKLWLRFDKKISAGDKLLFWRPTSPGGGFCQGSGTPEISVGDRESDTWALSKYVPRSWSSPGTKVVIRVDAAGMMSAWDDGSAPQSVTQGN